MSRSIRSKFKVCSVTNKGNQYQFIELSAVTDNSEENKSFSRYTPWGEVKITISNPDAIDFFVPGKEYYLDFSPVAATEPVAQPVETGLTEDALVVNKIS